MELNSKGMETKLSDLRPDIDHILCQAALVGSRVIAKDATVLDADEYFDKSINGDCSRCPAVEHCALCILEE